MFEGRREARHGQRPTNAVGLRAFFDLIHRRDGVKLEVNKLPKNINMKKAYTKVWSERAIGRRTTSAPIARRFPVSKNFGNEAITIL